MKRIILTFLILSFTTVLSADSIQLRTGDTINGAIVKETEESVEIKTEIGVPILYYKDEILRINKEEAPAPMAEVEGKDVSIPDVNVFDVVPELYEIDQDVSQSEAMEAYQKGLAAAGKGNLVQAREYFLDSIEKEPSFVDAYYNLGVILGILEDFEQSKFYLAKAIQMDPSSEDAYYSLGISYNALGEREKAKDNFLKAIELKPDFKDAAYKLGVVYASLEQFHQAKRYFRKAVTLEPDFIPGYFQLGVVCSTIGQDTQAIENFQKVIELDPNLADAYYNLGLIYGSMKDYDKAIKAFKQVVDLNDQYSDAYYNLGLAYLGLSNESLTIGSLGGFDQARMYLERAQYLYTQEVNMDRIDEIQIILQNLP